MAAELDDGGGNGVGLGHPPGLNPHAKPLVGPQQPAQPLDTSASVAPPSVAEPPTAPQPLPEQAAAQPPAVPTAPAITPMPPPPGWYGDIYGSPPRWWDGTVWTEHLLIPLPSAEPPAYDEPELNFFDNAVISFSLAPDWVKFLTAALVAAAIALAALTFTGDDSGDGDVPDGFVPQPPELEEGTIPGDGAAPAPLPDGSSIPR